MLRKKMTTEKPVIKYDRRQVSPEVVPRQGISIVWFVPFIALIFGGWLGIKALSEQGVCITIEFDNGAGIIPKKTEIRYKGLITGMVNKVEPSEDLTSVIAEVEMTKSFAQYLTSKTQFWLVSADISLQGISGLDTLLSGSYINIIPDTDETAQSQDHFIALSEAPQADMTSPGLYLTLQTSVLGSISENSPITFKQIPIGYVTGYQYLEDDDVTIVVQVNGKVRDKITVAKGINQDDLEPLIFKSENVLKFTGGMTIVKKIYIPNKIFNIVVKP